MLYFYSMATKTDGRHNNIGQPRKLPQMKKQPVTIYETQDDIEALGGMDEVRSLLKRLFAQQLITNQSNKLWANKA